MSVGVSRGKGNHSVTLYKNKPNVSDHCETAKNCPSVWNGILYFYSCWNSAEKYWEGDCSNTWWKAHFTGISWLVKTPSEFDPQWKDIVCTAWSPSWIIVWRRIWPERRPLKPRWSETFFLSFKDKRPASETGKRWSHVLSKCFFSLSFTGRAFLRLNQNQCRMVRECPHSETVMQCSSCRESNLSRSGNKMFLLSLQLVLTSDSTRTRNSGIDETKLWARERTSTRTRLIATRTWKTSWGELTPCQVGKKKRQFSLDLNCRISRIVLTAVATSADFHQTGLNLLKKKENRTKAKVNVKSVNVFICRSHNVNGICCHQTHCSWSSSTSGEVVKQQKETRFCHSNGNPWFLMLYQPFGTAVVPPLLTWYMRCKPNEISRFPDYPHCRRDLLCAIIFSFCLLFFQTEHAPSTDVSLSFFLASVVRGLVSSAKVFWCSGERRQHWQNIAAKLWAIPEELCSAQGGEGEMVYSAWQQQRWVSFLEVNFILFDTLKLTQPPVVIPDKVFLGKEILPTAAFSVVTLGNWMVCSLHVFLRSRKM